MTDREPAGIEKMLVAYARTPIAIRQATAGISQADAVTAPAPGEWSVAQVVAHLWALDGHALVTFAGAGSPSESLMRPRNPPSFTELLDAFELRRAAVVAAMRTLAPELWDTPFAFRSAERTARQLVTRFVRHDATHIRQIAAARQGREEESG